MIKSYNCRTESYENIHTYVQTFVHLGLYGEVSFEKVKHSKLVCIIQLNKLQCGVTVDYAVLN